MRSMLRRRGSSSVAGAKRYFTAHRRKKFRYGVQVSGKRSLSSVALVSVELMFGKRDDASARAQSENEGTSRGQHLRGERHV